MGADGGRPSTRDLRPQCPTRSRGRPVRSGASAVLRSRASGCGARRLPPSKRWPQCCSVRTRIVSACFLDFCVKGQKVAHPINVRVSLSSSALLFGLKFKPMELWLELNFNLPERCVRSRQDGGAGFALRRGFACDSPVSPAAGPPAAPCSGRQGVFWRGPRCLLVSGEWAVSVGERQEGASLLRPPQGQLWGEESKLLAQVFGFWLRGPAGTCTCALCSGCRRRTRGECFAANLDCKCLGMSLSSGCEAELLGPRDEGR